MCRRVQNRLLFSETTWIEGAAIDQLHQVAALEGVSAVKAFPDLHPGKYGPVGCAVVADRIYPQLIGNDIGCGMSLFALDLPVRKLRIDKAATKLRALEGAWEGATDGHLRSAGLPAGLHATALGTIGGGNHFCEVQKVGEILDETSAATAGIAKDGLLLLVHSGSRSLGMVVFGGLRSHVDALAPDGLAAEDYMRGHDAAVLWAKLNRQVIAERAANTLRCDLQLIADSPHNLVENCGGRFLHRKGAAKADMPLVPLAGSRDAPSFLLRPLDGVAQSLHSLAHGSGRKYDRQSMHGRVGGTKSAREKLARNSHGGVVVCEDRQLLIEQAPSAYKDPAQVLGDLVGAGLVANIASLTPLITYKKAGDQRDSRRKRDRLLHRRRDR